MLQTPGKQRKKRSYLPNEEDIVLKYVYEDDLLAKKFDDPNL